MNCDPWWSSPLIQVGGPLLAVTSLLLVVFAASMTPLRRDPAAAATTRPSPVFTSPVLSAPHPLASSASLGPLSPPTMAVANAFPVLPRLPERAFLPPPDLERAQFDQLEELRFQVRSASAAMRSLRDWHPGYSSARPAGALVSTAQAAPAF